MLGRSLSLAVALGFLSGAACSPQAPTEPRRGNTQKVARIVDGKKSTTAQDATVLLTIGDSSCSGTLIAPNLVLTARHCVATPKSDKGECSGFEAPRDAGEVGVVLGVDASFGDSPVARGKKLFLPKTVSSCGFDIALVQLAEDIDSKTAKVRFSALGASESFVAVGYGVDGQGKENRSRMQRSTKLLGVGPKKISYPTKDGESVSYDVPKGDVATGESTCNGDSGGPLFDKEGAVVAVTSRGIDAQTQGDHGPGNCIDLPAVYASTRSNEALIRNAARSAGHALPEDSTEPDGAETSGGDEESKKGGSHEDDESEPEPANVTPSRKDGAEDEGGERVELGGEDDDAKKTPKAAPPPAAGACALGPRRAPGGGEAGAGIALAVGLLLLRRRARVLRR